MFSAADFDALDATIRTALSDPRRSYAIPGLSVQKLTWAEMIKMRSDMRIANAATEGPFEEFQVLRPV